MLVDIRKATTPTKKTWSDYFYIFIRITLVFLVPKRIRNGIRVKIMWAMATHYCFHFTWTEFIPKHWWRCQTRRYGNLMHSFSVTVWMTSLCCTQQISRSFWLGARIVKRRFIGASRHLTSLVVAFAMEQALNIEWNSTGWLLMQLSELSNTIMRMVTLLLMFVKP